jgi:putative heme-binding domain-containing protein
MIKALSAISFDQLSESKQVDLLRAYEIMFFRMGMPSEPNKQVILSQLNNHYPSKTDLLNRQLSKVLIYLEAPQVAERTMALLEKAKNSTEKDDRYNQASELILRNPQYGLDIAEMLKKMPPSQQTYFAIMLSKLKNGWTPELREQYFTWFNTAFSYSGGRSYKGFIDRARKEALTHVPKDKLEHYDKISAEAMNANNENLANVTRPKGPWRVWLKDSAVAVVEGNLNNRDFEQGKNMFIATGCLSCHNMRGEGSNIGPDLTQLGTRFSSRDMLEHIIDPHKEVSDQYASTIFSLQDGSSVVGRLARQNDKSYFISQNPYSPDEVREIPKSNVINTKVSSVSIMPPGLINILNEEELKDLMAYLMAGGNEEHPVYTGKTN